MFLEDALPVAGLEVFGVAVVASFLLKEVIIHLLHFLLDFEELCRDLRIEFTISRDVPEDLFQLLHVLAIQDSLGGLSVDVVNLAEPVESRTHTVCSVDLTIQRLQERALQRVVVGTVLFGELDVAYLVLATVAGILPEASGPATPKHGYSFRPFQKEQTMTNQKVVEITKCQTL